MKKVSIVIVLFLVSSCTFLFGQELPILEDIELKTFEDHYTTQETVTICTEEGATFETDLRIITVDIAPKEYAVVQGTHTKDYFCSIQVSLAISTSDGESLQEFLSYLNFESGTQRLFWDHAGYPEADRASELFGYDDPVGVEDDYVKVTLALHSFALSEYQCADCSTDAATPLIFIDIIQFSLEISYTESQVDLIERKSDVYQAAADYYEEGVDTFGEAAQTNDYQGAIDKYEEAKSSFKKAKAEFDRVDDEIKSKECETWIEQCDEEIDNLKGVGTLREKLIYIIVAIVVVAGAGVLMKQLGKGKPPKEAPKKGMTLRVQNAETGEDTTIQVNPTDKVGKIRQLAATKLSIIPSALLYNGKECPPDYTAQECGLTDGATVKVVPRGREKEGKYEIKGVRAENLEKLKKLEQKYREGKISKELYESLKRKLES